MKLTPKQKRFFTALQDEGVSVEAFINNCDDVSETLAFISERNITFSNVLDNAFTWDDTDQGGVYWSEIWYNLRGRTR